MQRFTLLNMISEATKRQSEISDYLKKGSIESFPGAKDSDKFLGATDSDKFLGPNDCGDKFLGLGIALFITILVINMMILVLAVYLVVRAKSMGKIKDGAYTGMLILSLFFPVISIMIILIAYN
jgi:hypothetical protein